ncbi:MAG TPA: hypothetical protein VGE45_00960 [Chloroflexia bacterium]|jgi:hypothetical protein
MNNPIKVSYLVRDENKAETVGWTLFSQEEWDEYLKNIRFDYEHFKEDEWPLSYYWNDDDNDVLIFDDPDEYINCFKVETLSGKEAEILNKHCPDGWGLFPYFSDYEAGPYKKTLAKWAETDEEKAIYRERYGEEVHD